ncbi:MAG: FAD-dependent monooxygenase, partial [Myxococcota bacterium]
LAEADPESYAAIAANFAHWDDIDTFVHGQRVRSTGHGFCGLQRKALLLILQDRCRELGVTLHYQRAIADPAQAIAGELADADLIVAADGVGSAVRAAFAENFEPDIDTRPNRFVWLGTTFPFEAFTFYFKQGEHGLFRVHAYRYQDAGSTFIVECTEDTWRRAGLDEADEDGTIAYLGALFADELAGHPLIKNRSIWRSFPTVRNRRWHHCNVVLVGDAAHTAHFSIGSGTKLAMEDCIHLSRALGRALDGTARLSPSDLSAALTAYEDGRRPEVEALQRAAQVSLEWFENTERYMQLPAQQFAFSLLTRSLRVSHRNLARRDPALVAEADRQFAAAARARAGLAPMTADDVVPPPMFTPLKLGEMVVDNRVVGLAPASGRGEGGALGDFHLMHLGGWAVGGCGLIVSEPLAVCAGGRADPANPGLHSDAGQGGLARVAGFIHGESAGKLAALLSVAVQPRVGRIGAAARAHRQRLGH